jgi:hypothetical protein
MFAFKNFIIAALLILALPILFAQTAHATPTTTSVTAIADQIESARFVANVMEGRAKRQLAQGFKADTDATLRSLEKHLAVEMRDLVNARIDSSDPAMKRQIDLLITEADAQMRRVGVLRGLITISLRHYEGFHESE